MNEFLRRNPIVAGLAVLCVVLAAVIAAELFALGRASPPAAPRKIAPSEVKLVPPLAATTAEASYPETASRPLWIPTRRPAPAPAAVASQTFTRGQFILQGVTIAGSTRIALLKEKASGKVHRVELGRDIAGLHLAEVEPERVTLSQGAEREVLDLRVQKGAGAPAPGSPAQPPPPPSAMAGTAASPSGRTGPFAPPPVSPMPGGVPLIPPGPMPPSAMPPSPAAPAANSANPANAVPGAVPQQSSAPMTPEELLARRRARRNQPTE